MPKVKVGRRQVGRKGEDVATIRIKEDMGGIKVHLLAERITIKSSFTYKALRGLHT